MHAASYTSPRPPPEYILDRSLASLTKLNRATCIHVYSLAIANPHMYKSTCRHAGLVPADSNSQPLKLT